MNVLLKTRSASGDPDPAVVFKIRVACNDKRFTFGKAFQNFNSIPLLNAQRERSADSDRITLYNKSGKGTIQFDRSCFRLDIGSHLLHHRRDRKYTRMNSS